MSLDVFFQPDVARSLAAIAQAHTDAARLMNHTTRTQGYREGYADALKAVAVAFGLSQPRQQTQTMNVRCHPRLQFAESEVNP